MLDAELLALNVYEEAGGEIDDGRAAVARVTLNRMRRRFFSDGTVAGTVLAKDQFSWAWFEMENGVYTRVCHTPADAHTRAELLLARAGQVALGQCEVIAANVLVGAYHGPFYDQLTDDAVLYLNPRILTALPAWATPPAFICSIGRHDFYRSVPAVVT